jgi:hypothetical protein
MILFCRENLSNQSHLAIHKKLAKDKKPCFYDYGKLPSPYPCQSGLLRQFVVGINAPPLTELTFSAEFTSTLTIAINDPLDTIRLFTTIEANNLGSTLDAPLPHRITYQIRRVEPEQVAIDVQDTNIDIVTTTFSAIDRPGVGFFTYVLEGRISGFAQNNDSNEEVLDVVFTAEEIENNIPC